MNKDEMKKRADGWQNISTKLGKTGFDKTKGTSFCGDIFLSEDELTSIYIEDGIGSRVITRPAKDAFRRWFTVDGDEENKVQKRLESLHAKAKFIEAQAWARLYGGALIIMNTNDGQELENPLDKNMKTQVIGLKIFPRTNVIIDYTNIDMDPKSPTFEEPLSFTIHPTLGGTSFQVHSSRCLVFKGLRVPNVMGSVSRSADAMSDCFWGVSALYPVYTNLKNLMSSIGGVSNVMQELVLKVFKISQLGQQLAGGNEDYVVARMEAINLTMSMINAVLLDESEGFERNEAALTGADGVLSALMLMVSASSGIPVTLLYGRSPAGMNATGESDIRLYYDDINGEQEASIGPAIRPLVEIEAAQAGISDPVIAWNPLWEPSEKEVLENRKKQAEIDKIYVIDIGALTEAEVRELRFMGGYSTEMSVEEGSEPEDSFTPGETTEKGDGIMSRIRAKLKKK